MFKSFSRLMTWKNMHQPSESRLRLLDAMLSRPDTGSSSTSYCVPHSLASNIIQMIEEAGEWPRNKMLPSDPLSSVFHGPSESDMVFGRFARAFYKKFGHRISIKEIADALDIDKACVGDLLGYIDKSVNGAVQTHSRT